MLARFEGLAVFEALARFEALTMPEMLRSVTGARDMANSPLISDFTYYYAPNGRIVRLDA
jgi:hypothetical protein